MATNRSLNPYWLDLTQGQQDDGKGILCLNPYWLDLTNLKKQKKTDSLLKSKSILVRFNIP